MFAAKVLLVLGAFLLLNSSTAMRCRTEDGPSMDDVKKVVRTCMSKHDSSGTLNKNSNRSNKYEYDDSDDSSDSDEDEDQSQDDTRSNNRHSQGNQYPNNGDNRGNNNNNGNNNQYGYDSRQNGHQNHRQYLVAGGSDRMRIRRLVAGLQPMDASSNPWNWKKESIYNSADANRQQRSYEASNSSGRGESDNNSTSKMRNPDSNSCMVLCFFQEMKMTNRDGFPDKHKMLSVMTHDLRDMQLKDFYMDTIQECHHILEMEQTRDKCAFARHLVTCLSERARSNCEDFQDSILF